MKDSIGGPVGSLIVLRPWQRSLLRGMLATDASGRLVARTAYVGVPRKNGKTALFAGLAAYALFLGPDGGEVYSVAGDRDQARIAFDTGKRMIAMDAELSARSKVYRDAIEVPEYGSVWRVVSSDAPLKEGLSPTFTLVDEVHVIDRDLWDVFALAQGARPEPFMAGITTAGARVDSHGRDTLAFELFQYGRRLAAGELEDPSFYFAWWGAADDEPHADPRTWARANPGLGDIVAVEDFETRVLSTPEAEFRTKRLNQWVTSYKAWLPSGRFEALARPDRAISPDEPIILAFDGSWSDDSTAVIGCTLDGFLEPLATWEKPLGDLQWRVNVAEVEAELLRLADAYNVVEFTGDPYHYERTFQLLEEHGLRVSTFSNTATRMVPACQTFFGAVISGSLSHNGDPALVRHVANAVVKVDRFGPRITKNGHNQKIDLAVAAVMAYNRALDVAAEAPKPTPQLFVW